LQSCQIEVGLIEPVEQYQRAGAGIVQGHGHVADGTEIGTKLHRDRDRDRRSHRSQDVEIALLDITARRRKIGWNEIDVEFEPVGAGLFELFGVGGPALVADSVQAGNHRHVETLPGPANEFEILVRPMFGIGQFRKVAETLRPALIVHAGQMLVPGRLRLDLLLEKRRQDHGGGPGILEPLQRIELSRQRRRGCHQRILELKSHVARRQIHRGLLGQVGRGERAARALN